MQDYNGGIVVKSEHTTLLRDDHVIKEVADMFYAEHFAVKAGRMITDAKTKFKNRVGEEIVRDTLLLNEISSMEAEVIQGGIHLVYRTRGNKFKFWVTTPDVKVLGFEVGASRDLDPGFEVFFDINIHVQALNADSLSNIKLKSSWVVLDISYEGSNITGKLAVGIVKIIDKTIAWIKGDDGFLKDLQHYTMDLPQIKDAINAKLEELLNQNHLLLQEMEVDDSDNLRYEFENGQLILLHTHSPGGILKRVSTTSVAEAMQKNSVSQGSTQASSSTGVTDALNGGLRSGRRE